MAVEMGAEYYILHPGRLAFYSLSSQKVFFMEQRYPERVGELLVKSLECLLDSSRGRIELCIENTHTFSSPFLKIISGLTSNKGLRLVWDVGHTEQLPDPQRSQLIAFFQQNIMSVKLAHLHDIDGSTDHKALGSGRLNVASYLEIFNALSDPTRVRIISALNARELCVCDLAALLGMTQSAISHQLRLLRTLRLVRNRKDGRIVYYSLDDEHIRDLFQRGVDHITHDLQPVKDMA